MGPLSPIGFSDLVWGLDFLVHYLAVEVEGTQAGSQEAWVFCSVFPAYWATLVKSHSPPTLSHNFLICKLLG